MLDSALKKCIPFAGFALPSVEETSAPHLRQNIVTEFTWETTSCKPTFMWKPRVKGNLSHPKIIVEHLFLLQSFPNERVSLIRPFDPDRLKTPTLPFSETHEDHSLGFRRESITLLLLLLDHARLGLQPKHRRFLQIHVELLQKWPFFRFPICQHQENPVGEPPP
mmetsp:Transcript_25893/g.39685  ORF Transcript_25893/g.39685 Transcript_25893/m.39685 type:complete len:165 (-) Transcript_25893:473-967(-)